MKPEDLLTKGLQALNLPVNTTNVAKLVAHMHILQKWNQKYNLTAITSIDDMVNLHVLDSLSIHKYLIGNDFLDFGSGAGFPGIPLAILNPDKKFVLLDSVLKKTRFLSYLINEISLTNVSVVQSRIEDYRVDRLFDGVLVRAVGSPIKVYQQCERLLQRDGRAYLMAAKNLALPTDDKIKTKVVELSVPFIKVTRNLILINK